MTTERTINLKCTETINGIVVTFQANHNPEQAPETIKVTASVMTPGLDVRLNRDYTVNSEYTPKPSVDSPLNPFSTEFENAIIAVVQNIFTNYATI